MQSIKNNLSKYDIKNSLKSDYVKALKDDKFKALIARLKLKEEDALKYTSKLERTVCELSNCEKCKHLFECKNEVEGFVYYPEYYNEMLNFDYIACKYKKQQLKRDSENKACFYEMPLNLKNASMKDIDITDRNRTEVIKYLTDFYDKYGVTKTKGCYLHGSFGCGKSYLISALLNELAKKNYSVIIMYYPEMLRRLKESFGLEDAFSKYMESFKSVDLLLIDDIGAETVSTWNRDEILGTILQARMDNNLATFFTSNFTLEELEEHFISSKGRDDYVKAQRIMERIRYLCKDMGINSENRRNH